MLVKQSPCCEQTSNDEGLYQGKPLITLLGVTKSEYLSPHLRSRQDTWCLDGGKGIS